MSAAPAGPWVIAGARRRTQAQITDRAARAATGFRQAGIGADAAVALLLRNDFAFFEATQAPAWPAPIRCL